MTSLFGEWVRAAFAPPRYLSPPLAGIDVSTSGVKAVRLSEGSHGLILAGYADERLISGAFADGEIVDRAVVAAAVAAAAKTAGIYAANVSLPESKSYLFETSVPGGDKAEWRTAVEQRLDEFVPLPPPETVFDIVKTGQGEGGNALVAGIGFAHRIIDDMLSVFDEAHVKVQALEGETFASARALLHKGDDTTVLIIDVGRSTTKLSIVAGGVPRFATTIGIGGHALTLSVQKHFGVTEQEARKIKADRGIVPVPGNEDYLSAMLSTVSAIRDEISRRLDYWREKVVASGAHGPVTHAILVGGNASVRGFGEYLESALKMPVAAGDIFANFASRDTWIPTLDFTESLAYATAIGLALRDDTQLYG
ncbi:MAG: type 4 fimbrial biosis protein PilM, type pilus assembly protein PilM [Candidatus Parcubacteria bacterium]|jgi:type IV pilus assembly protein PilM